MLLVDKNTLNIEGDISEKDKEVLLSGYSHNPLYAEEYKNLLHRIRSKNCFIQCDCKTRTKSMPMLGTRLLREKELVLVNLSGRSPHDDNCSFSYFKCDPNHQKNKSYELLIENDDLGRVTISSDILSSLYPEMCESAGLNTLSDCLATSDIDFKSLLIDGARMTPILAKNGAGRKIHFGLNSFREIQSELKVAENGDFRIQISVINGFDEYSIFKGWGDKRFSIPCGNVISNLKTNIGPFIATTFYSKKNKSVFPVKTSIIPCLSIEYPVPVRSDEQRDLVNELIKPKGLFEWLKSKDRLCDLSVTIPLKTEMSAISKEPISPLLKISNKSLVCILGDPLKDKRHLYLETGSLVWHRHFNSIPEKRKREMSDLKRNISGVLLSA